MVMNVALRELFVTYLTLNGPEKKWCCFVLLKPVAPEL